MVPAFSKISSTNHVGFGTECEFNSYGESVSENENGNRNTNVDDAWHKYKSVKLNDLCIDHLIVDYMTQWNNLNL